MTFKELFEEYVKYSNTIIFITVNRDWEGNFILYIFYCKITLIIVSPDTFQSERNTKCELLYVESNTRIFLNTYFN